MNNSNSHNPTAKEAITRPEFDMDWADDPASCGSLQAAQEGMEAALVEILERGESIRDAAFDRPPSPESRRLEGALPIWRAAYSAAFREALVIEEAQRSWDECRMPDLSNHPFENARDHDNYTKFEARMVELEAKYPERLNGRPLQWWKETERPDASSERDVDPLLLSEDQIAVLLLGLRGPLFRSSLGWSPDVRTPPKELVTLYAPTTIKSLWKRGLLQGNFSDPRGVEADYWGLKNTDGATFKHSPEIPKLLVWTTFKGRSVLVEGGMLDDTIAIKFHHDQLTCH